MDDKNSSFLLKQSIQRSHHCIHKYKLPANLLILETINLYIRLFLCSHLSVSFNFHHPAMMIIWLLVIGCIYTWLDTNYLWYSPFGLENFLGIPGGKARVGDEEWSFLWIMHCSLISFSATPCYLLPRFFCPQLVIVFSACYKNHQREHGEPEQLKQESK